MGNYLRKGLERLAKRRKIIGDIRGLGLMQAIELVRDRKKKTFAQKEQGRVVERAFRKGLLLLGCGESGIRFSPALNVKKNEIDTMLEILDDCLRRA
jgi:4-aminobutyrate aminotransferase